MKSAFVIKKGAYEKLVCVKCEAKTARIVGTGPIAPEFLGFTPVTLSCEAFCSICDEAI
jgi:hypothetical protein